MTPSDDDTVDVKALVRQHWDGRAAGFDAESQHGIHSEAQHERWLDVLRRWTGERSRSVLDLGCGTGVIALLLAELGHEVTGLDVAPAMLNQAHGKTRGKSLDPAFLLADAETLPFDDGVFELVTARHLIWTLPNPATAISEWRRVLQPGGRIVLFEGYWDHDEPWDEYELMHADLPMYDGRPAGELQEFLRSQGLKDIQRGELMDAELWGREPRHDYYVMAGTVPG